MVSAGTADIPIAEEAAVTAELLGNEVHRVYDVGVAGIHRVFSKLDIIRSCNVAIVVAGMEGALASVVGGLVDLPVIAVPTSVGYGANLGGITTLLSHAQQLCQRHRRGEYRITVMGQRIWHLSSTEKLRKTLYNDKGRVYNKTL